MKVAFYLFKYFPFGGLQRDFMAIAMECIARGHHVTVFTLHWQGKIPDKMDVHVLDVPGITNHSRYQHFSRVLENANGQYDLIVGFNKLPGLDVYFAADPCYKEKVKRFKSWFYRLTGRYRCFAKFEKSIFSLHSTTDILALTKAQIGEFQDHYETPDERFTLIPPWIKQDRIPPTDSHQIRQQLRQEFSIPDFHQLILFLGSGFQTKGLDRAMKAIGSLTVEQQKDIHLIVIGQDNFDPFHRLSNQLGLKATVRFLGGRQDAPRFLFAADLLLHPAYSESAGIVLLEATVAGLPILTTAACGYAHHITEAHSGVVLPEPFKQSALNNALKDLLFSGSPFQSDGIAYGQHHDFYHMPQTLVDYLETKAKDKTRYFDSMDHMTLRRDVNQTWGRSFNETMRTQGEIFRDVKGRKTLKFSHNHHNYFLKLHYGVGWLEIIKNLCFLRMPVLGARNEKLAIERLTQLTINTMTMVGFGEQGLNPAKRQSFIMTEALENMISLEDYCKDWKKSPPSFRQKTMLLTKIAQITAMLHQNGINHRDYYICHFLLEKNTVISSAEKLKLFLIDLHRVQLRSKVPARWIIKDLGGLFFSAFDLCLTRKDRLRFIKIYTDQPLQVALQYNLWSKVNGKAIELYKKGLPTEIVQ